MTAATSAAAGGGKGKAGAKWPESPMRFAIPEPPAAHYDPPKDSVFASNEPGQVWTPDGKVELKKSVDQ